MKNLILDIKYYLLFLLVVLVIFYLYLNFGMNFNKNFSPEIIADASFRDEITLQENQSEQIFKGALSKKIKVPVIAGGGLGNLDHLTKLAKMKGIDGISTSAALHYNHLKIDEIKTFLAKKKMNVRK